MDVNVLWLGAIEKQQAGKTACLIAISIGSEFTRTVMLDYTARK